MEPRRGRGGEHGHRRGHEETGAALVAGDHLHAEPRQHAVAAAQPAAVADDRGCAVELDGLAHARDRTGEHGHAKAAARDVEHAEAAGDLDTLVEIDAAAPVRSRAEHGPSLPADRYGNVPSASASLSWMPTA